MVTLQSHNHLNNICKAFQIKDKASSMDNTKVSLKFNIMIYQPASHQQIMLADSL